MERVDRAVTGVAVAWLALLLAALLCGCARTVYVPETRVVHDSVRVVQREAVDRWRVDSVLVKQRGDTVTVEKWKLRYTDRVRTDTVTVTRTDTVTVTRVVEAPAKQRPGGGNWWLAAVFAGLYLVYRKAAGRG